MVPVWEAGSSCSIADCPRIGDGRIDSRSKLSDVDRRAYLFPAKTFADIPNPSDWPTRHQLILAANLFAPEVVGSVPEPDTNVWISP